MYYLLQVISLLLFDEVFEIIFGSNLGKRHTEEALYIVIETLWSKVVGDVNLKIYLEFIDVLDLGNL